MMIAAVEYRFGRVDRLSGTIGADQPTGGRGAYKRDGFQVFLNMPNERRSYPGERS